MAIIMTHHMAATVIQVVGDQPIAGASICVAPMSPMSPMAPIEPAPTHTGEGSPGAGSPRPRRRRRLVAAVGLAVVLAGSLAACGADTGGDDVASLATGDQAGGTSTTEVKPLTEEEIAEAQQAFQDCMKEHGVDIQMAATAADGSDGGGMIMRTEGGGPGEDPPEDLPSTEEMDAANEECQPLMEKVIQNAPKPDPEEMARMKEQALQFAQCMRDNGVDMPDPEFSEDGGGITQSLGGPGQTEDPDMETAMQTCREFMKGPNGEEPPSPGDGPVMRQAPAGGSDSGSDS
jgi:hypothetical protein